MATERTYWTVCKICQYESESASPLDEIFTHMFYEHGLSADDAMSAVIVRESHLDTLFAFSDWLDWRSPHGRNA